MQDDVRALERLAPDVAARVRTKVGAQIAVIDAAMRSSWLPIALDVQLTEAVFDEVGEAGAQALAKDALKASLTGPLLRPFRDAAIKLFGIRTHAVLGVVPKAWGQIFRGVGDVAATQRSPQHAVITIAGACDEVLRSPAWCAGTAGTFQGIAEMSGALARAEVRIDVAARAVHFDLTW